MKHLLTGLIALAILLLIAILWIVSLQIRHGRLDDQHAALEAEKTELVAGQQRLQQENERKDRSILELQGEIETLRSEHEQALTERDRQIARLGRRAAEVEELRKKMEEFEHLQEEYEKLRTQYRQLVREYSNLDDTHGKTQAEYQALKDSVAKSRELHAYNIFALTKWERWLWADRYHVERARRVDETRVSFEINANPFAPSGRRNVYLNMVNPAGTVMYATADHFVLAGSDEQIPYTRMQEINYTGEPVRIQFTIAHPETLEPGTYRLRVYIDGRLSGEKEVRFE